MKHIKLYEDFVNESGDYAVMMVGGSIGDKKIVTSEDSHSPYGSKMKYRLMVAFF